MTKQHSHSGDLSSGGPGEAQSSNHGGFQFSDLFKPMPHHNGGHLDGGGRGHHQHHQGHLDGGRASHHNQNDGWGRSSLQNQFDAWGRPPQHGHHESGRSQHGQENPWFPPGHQQHGRTQHGHQGDGRGHNRSNAEGWPHSAFDDAGRASHRHENDGGAVDRRGHQHLQGRGHDSAHRHLPDLSITDGGNDHGRGRQGRNDGTHDQNDGTHGRDRTHGGDRTHSRDRTHGSDRAPDTGLGSWGGHGPSSQAIARAAAESVGRHTYLPRPGSAYYGQHIPAGLGCTSASTNMFFDGLKAAGKISDRDYKRVHQIGNDAAYVSLQHQGIAKPVNGHDLRPGDWAYFKNPGHKHGHSGVVFQDSHGNLMLANNRKGTTVATPLSTMMHKYQSVRGLRSSI